MAPSPDPRAREEGAGMARRRSPRLHPQTQASEEGAGVTPRRSPRLHPQIHANEEGGGVIRRRRRRRGTSPAASASLLDDDGMLWEILLRLPPQPSSLPRASAVCKRWRGLVGDPKFYRQFCAHHRKPPLLGVFSESSEGIVFNPIPDPPDRIPPGRLSLGRFGNTSDYDMLDCRHGLVLVKDCDRKEVAVCDPITGQQRCLAVPSELTRGDLAGAVLCAAADHCHVHGACHSTPFKVVLVSTCRRDNQPRVCVYSSDNAIWGNIISIEAPCRVFDADPGILIGSALYWLCISDHMLEFDLVEHNLAVISVPPLKNMWRANVRQIIQAEGGAVGFGMLSYPRFQMWQRNVDGHGVATWMPWKTIEMHTILGVPSQIEVRSVRLLGYDGDSDEIYLEVGSNVYRVQLKLMHSRKLYGTKYPNPYYSFKSFYTQAFREYDEAGMLHNP